MMTKLTLSTEEDIAKAAKQYARDNNTSVSAMFSRFIRGIEAQKKGETKAERPSTLDEIRGIIKLKEGETVNDLRRRAVRKRYGV